ncbi:dnaJ homolog subfamily C member 28 [Latimeria chalumnae]|nr:PREDICTED: dnaJ homolog subfamily C member 28 [Latimeria chalumnae]|eukprot:XP_006001534.1 PREDICTED: dnaJ homolog subfamily C member 28 [Latimeria chalumnae]
MKWLHLLLIQNMRHHILENTLIIKRKWILHSHPIFPMRLLSGYKSRKSIQECYSLLNLQEGCSLNEVKEAYHSLAKQYHPDSSSFAADPRKFVLVEEAYRAVLAHMEEKRRLEDSMKGDKEEENTKYRAPQHRQYLSFEGIGFGTPIQRERQYQKFRVDRASEEVMEYRKRKLESQPTDSTMMVKDIRHSKKVKITQAIDRLVEDLIQESMARGDFNNLSGRGKPLGKFSGCQFIDPMTHNLNRILIDNGYQPEWILMQKEIRETIMKLRDDLLLFRKKLGEPLTLHKEKQWSLHCQQFRKDIKALNKRINDFNLVVPLLNRQMVHFNADKEIERMLKSYSFMMEEMQKASLDEGQEKEKSEMVKSRTSFLNWINRILK